MKITKSLTAFFILYSTVVTCQTVASKNHKVVYNKQSTDALILEVQNSMPPKIDWSKLKNLVISGADVNVRINDLPLIWVALAIGYGSFDIKYNYSQNDRDSANRFGLIKLLVEKGADVNVSIDYLHETITPLIYAVNNRNINFARLLIAHGANVNFKTNDGNTPLMVACGDLNIDFAKLLIAHGANVNFKDKDGVMPLMMVAKRDTNVDFAKLLIEKGASINAVSSINHQGTPLICSINSAQGDYYEGAYRDRSKNQRITLIKYLIKKGANVNLKDSTGVSPLYEAIYSNELAVAKLLADSGAKITGNANETGFLEEEILPKSKEMKMFLINHQLIDTNINGTPKEVMPLAEPELSSLEQNGHGNDSVNATKILLTLALKVEQNVLFLIPNSGI